MRSTSFNKIACWLVLGLFVATFALSFFAPIYTDEVTVKIARIQVMLDGFQLTSLFPQCGAPFSLPIPWSWYPSAVIDGLLYGHLTEPIFIRVIGMTTFAVWLGLLLWFVRTKLRHSHDLQLTIVGLISLLTLGVLPFMMVLNRSEQPLLLGLTLVCILPGLVAHYQPRTNRAWILIFVVFLLATSYMFSSHPKTFFFIPLMLVSALHLSFASKRIWIGGVLLGGLGIVCYESLMFWTSRMSCPDAPVLDAILKSESLSIRTFFSAPQDFVLAGLRNMEKFYVYIKNILFHLSYQSDWLPPSYRSQQPGWFIGLVNVVVSLIYLSIVGYVIFALAKKMRSSMHKRKYLVDLTIPLTLLIGILSCSFFLASKNFYESSLILPLFILLLILILPAAIEANKNCRVCPFLFKSLLIVSIASQIILISAYSSYIPNTWLAGGQVAGQSLSISSFNYSKTKDDVIAAAANCDIKVGDLNRHLLIDDSTYFPFKNAQRPFHSLYVARSFGKDIGDRNLFQFLKEKGSDGLITSCSSLSPEVLKYTKAHANYCCMSKQDIDTLGQLSNSNATR